LLVNLGASLAGATGEPLLLDVTANESGIASRLRAGHGVTLIDAARSTMAFAEVIRDSGQGFGVATLGRHAVKDVDMLRRNDALAKLFAQIAGNVGIVLAELKLESDGGLPLAALAEGEIVVQVTPGGDSIKTAYGLIKQLNGMLGRRGYGVLVTGASEREAAQTFSNLAQTASRYLAVPLHSLGAVPADEHVARAARLGRCVVDAFPLASASVALRGLAGRLALPVAA
jgi:flagellar biosynthesis protein FlhG